MIPRSRPGDDPWQAITHNSKLQQDRTLKQNRSLQPDQSTINYANHSNLAVISAILILLLRCIELVSNFRISDPTVFDPLQILFLWLFIASSINALGLIVSRNSLRSSQARNALLLAFGLGFISLSSSIIIFSSYFIFYLPTLLLYSSLTSSTAPSNILDKQYWSKVGLALILLGYVFKFILYPKLDSSLPGLLIISLLIIITIINADTPSKAGRFISLIVSGFTIVIDESNITQEYLYNIIYTQLLSPSLPSFFLYSFTYFEMVPYGLIFFGMIMTSIQLILPQEEGIPFTRAVPEVEIEEKPEKVILPEPKPIGPSLQEKQQAYIKSIDIIRNRVVESGILNFSDSLVKIGRVEVNLVNTFSELYNNGSLLGFVSDSCFYSEEYILNLIRRKLSESKAEGKDLQVTDLAYNLKVSPNRLRDYIIALVQRNEISRN